MRRQPSVHRDSISRTARRSAVLRGEALDAILPDPVPVVARPEYPFLEAHIAPCSTRIDRVSHELT